MQLDWFTVGAQVVNFLLLVALLKRFLYGPIIRAMDQREAHIASRLEEAQVHMSNAERQAVLYENQLKELHNSRDSMLAQAQAEAEAQRQSLLEQARQEVQRLQAGWRHTLQREQAALLQELRQAAGQQVCATARHALTELARTNLEQEVVAVFLERLAALDDQARQTMAQAAQSAAQGLVVHSAFPLSANLRQRVLDAIRQQVADGVTVQFTIKPELICGIELEAQGRTLAWHMHAYLERLQDHFAAILAAELSGQEVSAAGGSASC